MDNGKCERINKIVDCLMVIALSFALRSLFAVSQSLYLENTPAHYEGCQAAAPPVTLREMVKDGTASVKQETLQLTENCSGVDGAVSQRDTAAHQQLL